MKRTRNTRQKTLILDILKDNHDHPSADEVFFMAHRRDPKISRGTVYRDLNQLADLGQIRRVSSTLGHDNYDCRVDRHYHFVCRKCDKMFDTPIPYQDSLDSTPSGMVGFVTESHRLLLVGLCPKCAKVNSKARNKTTTTKGKSDEKRD